MSGVHLRGIAVSLFIALSVGSGITTAQAFSERDPHRPICRTEECKKAKRSLKVHYCGKSPYGNGPDDGCDLRSPKPADMSAKKIASYDCQWNQQQQTLTCRQAGAIPASLARFLRNELQQLGLPSMYKNDVLFRVLSGPSGVSVAEAFYSRVHGTDLYISEVVAAFKNPDEPRVIRKLKYQKTDADVPNVTTWRPIDVRDLNEDGREEIVLEADAYEDHWLEAVSVGEDLSPRTIFSGLGFYL